MTGNPQITFVCCVESGWLENQTVRMIESLHRWGGQLANSPMIAVTPRFGLPLSHKTHQAFERLQVQYLRVPAKSKYTWMWLSFWPEFVKSLRTTHQPVANWLDSLGSMKNEAPVHWRITSKLLKKVRSRQESAYRESCQVI